MTKYKRLQQEVYDRDGACRICGKHTQAPPHHIIYKSHSGADVIRNMILLCEHHHRLVHRNEKKWRDILIEMQEEIYGHIDIEDLKKKDRYVNFKYNKGER